MRAEAAGTDTVPSRASLCGEACVYRDVLHIRAHCHFSAFFIRSMAISCCEAATVEVEGLMMTLTRTDSMAAAAAGAFLCLLAGESVLFADDPFDADPPTACGACGEQNELAPFGAFGDTYHVGTAHLAAAPVVSDGAGACRDDALSASTALERRIAAERRSAAALHMDF